MEATNDFVNEKITLEELLTAYQALLIDSDPKCKADFDQALFQHHDVLLSAVLADNVLSRAPLVDSQELETVVCIMIAQFCKTLRADELHLIPDRVFSFLASSPAAIARIYSSMIQSYARVLSTSNGDFATLPPTESLLEEVEAESELFSYILEVLATCAIFDSVKVELIAQHALQRMAARLAASESTEEVCGILGFIHSICFNLTDVVESEDKENARASVYDVVAPAVREIQLPMLLEAILEKDFSVGQSEVQFNILMILHGCLLPHTRELATLRWAQFAVNQVDIKHPITVQISCEAAIKIIAIAQKEERVAIADSIADNVELMRKLFAVLEISSDFEACGIIISLLQVAAAHCSIKEKYQQYPFSTLPILHYTHRLVRQLAENPLESVVSQLENCYQAMLYFTESRCPEKWQQIATTVESRSVLYLAESLGAVQGLISELRGIVGLVGVLCSHDAYLYGVEEDLKQKAGEFENVYKFLLKLCIDIKQKQGSRAYIVVVSILKGMSKYPECVKLLDPHDFVQLIECFKVDLSEQFDDVLMDIVEGFGDTCPREIMTQINQLLDDLAADK